MQQKYLSILIPDQCVNPLAYYVIRCLKEALGDLKITIIAASDPTSPDSSWPIFYKHSFYLNDLIISKKMIESTAYLDEVIQVIQAAKIDIIFAASEAGFKFVSQHREKLSSCCKLIVLPEHNALKTAFDKWSLYLFLKDHKIPVPKTTLLSKVDLLSQFNYPVLIKPIDGSSGRNIRKFNHFSKDEFQIISSHSQNTYIIQEYIEGYDIGCNVLCQNGKILAYTIQQLLGAEEGFAPKVEKLKFVHDSAVIDLVERTMGSLQWSGVANIDLRYDARTGQLYVLEINPRFWQSLMGSLSVGVNFPYLLYLLSSGIEFEPISYKEKYYAKVQRFIADALNGSLHYRISDTNIKYLLSDPNSALQFLLHKLLSNKVQNYARKIPHQEPQKAMDSLK